MAKKTNEILDKIVDLTTFLILGQNLVQYFVRFWAMEFQEIAFEIYWPFEEMRKRNCASEISWPLSKSHWHFSFSFHCDLWMALDLTDWTDAARAKVEKQPFFLFGHQTMVVLIRKSRVLPTYWILSSGNTVGPNCLLKLRPFEFLEIRDHTRLGRNYPSKISTVLKRLEYIF